MDSNPTKKNLPQCTMDDRTPLEPYVRPELRVLGKAQEHTRGFNPGPAEPQGSAAS